MGRLDLTECFSSQGKDKPAGIPWLVLLQPCWGRGGAHFANPEDAWAAAAWALSKGAGWSALGPVLGKWETELCNEQKARWSFLVKFALLGGRRSGGGEGRSELAGPSGVFMKRDTSSQPLFP